LGNQNAILSNEALLSAPNGKLPVSISSSTSQKRKAQEDDHNDQEKVLKQPNLGDSSSCDDDDDMIERSFSSSSSSHPITANNTLHQFSTSLTSSPPTVPFNYPILPLKSKLALTASLPIHSLIPPNSQQIKLYTSLSSTRLQMQDMFAASQLFLGPSIIKLHYLSELCNLSSINPGH